MCNLIQYCSLNLYTTVMFLTLKRNTLYTIVILLSLAYFTPGFASIDPEKPKQAQTEQGDGDTQEDVENQEQDEVPQDSELEESVNPTDTVEMNESPSFNSEISIPELSNPEVIEPSGEVDFYDEEEEDTSESVISFNFLYYLLQKFKFSDSMNY